MKENLDLPTRRGEKPRTTNQLPHSQLDQHGPDHIIDKLHDFCFSLDGVENQHSAISVPGSRALVMHESHECNHDAFMIGREFAHIHPHPDSGSMHVILDEHGAIEAKEKGWGEDHYLVSQGQFRHGLIMVFSPRDESELETVKKLILRSYKFAIEVPT